MVNLKKSVVVAVSLLLAISLSGCTRNTILAVSQDFPTSAPKVSLDASISFENTELDKIGVKTCEQLKTRLKSELDKAGVDPNDKDTKNALAIYDRLKTFETQDGSLECGVTGVVNTVASFGFDMNKDVKFDTEKNEVVLSMPKEHFAVFADNGQAQDDVTKQFNAPGRTRIVMPGKIKEARLGGKLLKTDNGESPNVIYLPPKFEADSLKVVSEPLSETSRSISTPAIVAMVAGSVAVLVGALIVAMFVTRRRKMAE